MLRTIVILLVFALLGACNMRGKPRWHTQELRDFCEARGHGPGSAGWDDCITEHSFRGRGESLAWKYRVPAGDQSGR